jgi:hypothetical protein
MVSFANIIDNLGVPKLAEIFATVFIVAIEF